jgi:hypothetical protein
VAIQTCQRPPCEPSPGANWATPPWSKFVNAMMGSVPVPAGTLAALPNVRYATPSIQEPSHGASSSVGSPVVDLEHHPAARR